MSGRDTAVDREALRLLLIFSFRYALGRQTAAPTEVQELVKQYVGVLSLHDRVQLAEDIDRAPSLGNERIDAPGWRSLASWLRKLPA